MEARRTFKAAAAYALQKTAAARAMVAARRMLAGGRRVVILGYHRVCDDFPTERSSSIESCLISRDTFRRHVEFLAGRFELATVSRAVEVLSGRARADRDLAVITFDDGYQDVLTNALPVLRDWNAPATMYVSTGVVEHGGHFLHDRLYTLLCSFSTSEHLRQQTPPTARRMIEEAREAAGRGPVRLWLHHLIDRHAPDALEGLADCLAAAAPDSVPPRGAIALGWEGVRELAANGFEIGAHTVSHCVLTHLDTARIDREVRASREALEGRLGAAVRHFAYCNGYYNAAVIEVLKRRGFVSGVTTEDRLNRLGDDPFRLARRCQWEGSALGPGGRVSENLLACQLDDVWATLGLGASESGLRDARHRMDPDGRQGMLA